MFRRLTYRLTTLVLAASGFLNTDTPLSAQQAKTVFCFTDGSKIGAERFETRDGKFLLYVPGSTTPLEYPAANVCSVNVEPCNCPPPSKKDDTGGPPPQGDVLRFGIHGSNTIGERLMPMLIEAYARNNFGAAPLTKLVKPKEMELTIRSDSETKAIIDFQSHGSGTASKGLVEGKAQIGMASRQLKKEEADAVHDRFGIDPFAAGNEHVLALDGLAVIVSPDNPVEQLSLEQIGRIFSGVVTNWREVGGSDRPITLYRRDDKSGTFDTFKYLILDPLGLKIAPGAQKFESSELLAEAAAKDPGGIGFIALPYVGKGNRALKIGSNCGLTSAPTRFSIKSEEYPLARRLYLYTNGTPSAPIARDILKFALSDDAQATVSEAEFFNLGVEFQNAEDQRSWARGIVNNPTSALGADKAVPASAIRFFDDAMTGMRRASMEFRFRPGSATLDTRALQDVDRLGRYLSSSAVAGRRFYIVGFADSDGGWPRNEALARRRAETVADLLTSEHHVRVQRSNVKSLSYLAPVSCNDSDAGKGKNRRVEVWIGDR
jgi:phosphate transport system substrate-binding protein